MKYKNLSDFVNFIYQDLNYSIEKKEIEQILILFLDKFKEKLLQGYKFKIFNFGSIFNKPRVGHRRLNIATKEISFVENKNNRIQLQLTYTFKQFIKQYIQKGDLHHGHANE